MSEHIDVEAIMKEIKEEAKKNSTRGSVPAFEDVKMIPAAPKDWSVSCAYPASGNPLKRLFSRIMSKAVRCVLFPLTERLTVIHHEMQQRMDEMAATIEEQREEIDELHRRLDRAEKGNR